MNQWQQEFERWLNNELSEQQAQNLYQQLCAHAPDIAEQMAAMQQFQQDADAWVDAPVPDWNREATWQPALRSSASTESWWQRPWLPVTSFACSLLAVALVVLQVDVVVSDSQLRIAFGGQVNDEQLASLVDARLDEFTAKQTQELKTYATAMREDFREDLNQANTQLVSYVLATSRDERREDFADLIRYVNEQRQDDQVFYVNQFRQLQEAVGEPVTEYPFYRASALEE
ncbi:MAG: hypothetical protein WEA82_05850 [Idiomarina sp.]